MQIFLRILKETGIAIVFLIIITAVVWLLFQKHVPFLGEKIPDPIEYAEINKADFDIEGGIESETNPTLIYEATTANLQQYQDDRLVSTGTINPFTMSNSTGSDVPSERVTISNSANGNQNTDTVDNTTFEDMDATDSGIKSLE